MSERIFHDWLARRLNTGDPKVIAGCGIDDCAHVDIADISKLALSTDTIVEGTHFDAEADPLSVGHKAMAAALSDLAASGCKPLWGLVAINMRRGLGDRWAMRMMEGVSACAKLYGMSIVGGDTTSSYGPTSINVTVTGTPYKDNPIRRDQAEPGDLLILTGELGGSILSKHMNPVPRFREIEKILEFVPVKAGMDISDGLSIDISRMLAASNVGAILEEGEIPVSNDARELAKTSGQSPMAHALSDGEDFELLLAIPSGTWEGLKFEWEKTGIKTRLSCIGRIEYDQGLSMANPEGTLTNIVSNGYEHDF